MVEWITHDGLLAYDEAVAFMEDRADAIARGEAEECIWLVEHPRFTRRALRPNPTT